MTPDPNPEALFAVVVEISVCLGKAQEQRYKAPTPPHGRFPKTHSKTLIPSTLNSWECSPWLQQVSEEVSGGAHPSTPLTSPFHCSLNICLSQHHKEFVLPHFLGGGCVWSVPVTALDWRSWEQKVPHPTTGDSWLRVSPSETSRKMSRRAMAALSCVFGCISLDAQSLEMAGTAPWGGGPVSQG